MPWRAGVPRDATSDLEKFEALDPAEWCPRGYAIVNVDSRGVFDSGGNMFMLGTQVSQVEGQALFFEVCADHMTRIRMDGMVTMLSNSLLPRSGATALWHLLAIPTLQLLSGMHTPKRQALPLCSANPLPLGRFIAAERPPHLKAIAPWEGFADSYRELLGRGGIPNPSFVDYRGSGYCGTNFIPSIPE